MRFIWSDYDPDAAPYVETWLDESAVKTTGMDDGWRAFHEYWITEGGMTPDKNYWCKVVYDGTTPFAVIALSVYEGVFHIMELLVKPEMRNKGLGAALLHELLSDGENIIGNRIGRSGAVIFPCNTASQKAFEKAGFVFDHANDDGDAWYYKYSENRAGLSQIKSNPFHGRAGYYNKGRPGYPKECIDYIINKFELSSDSVIADIGAGTGILTRPFLEYGCRVYAVEPEKNMFTVLKENLCRYPNAVLLPTCAENTEIPESACDAAVIGTAFHWFDKENFRRECLRFLKDHRYIAILRISNNTESDKDIDRANGFTERDVQTAKDFFKNGFTERITFEYTEKYNAERFVAEKLSSATAPLPGDPNFEPYVWRCQTVYKKHFGNETAELPFAVNCCIGRLI